MPQKGGKSPSFNTRIHIVSHKRCGNKINLYWPTTISLQCWCQIFVVKSILKQSLEEETSIPFFLHAHLSKELH